MESTVEKFLENLHDLMVDNNLSFEKLGQHIKINPRTMRRWYEDRVPKLESLIKISDYFKCSIDYLLGLTDIVTFNSIQEPVPFIVRYDSLLRKNNLNDYRISKLCCIGTGTVAKWRRGRTPDTPSLIKLCDIFGCHFEYLVGRSN